MTNPTSISRHDIKRHLIATTRGSDAAKHFSGRPINMHATHMQLGSTKATPMDHEALTEEFFNAYKNVLETYQVSLISQRKAKKETCQEFTRQFFNRMMFLYFIQKKGWLCHDNRYLVNLFSRYARTRNGGNRAQHNFYHQYLAPLFFESLTARHNFAAYAIPAEIQAEYSSMPRLNAGLFQENEIDALNFEISDELVGTLFDQLLEKYDFTINENSSTDQDAAVDPETLGKVQESLLLEEERGKAGIFYTSRIEIDCMCKQSLAYYLGSRTGMDQGKIIVLVHGAKPDLESISAGELNQLVLALESVKIIDPACGSGSFLVQFTEILKTLLERIYFRLNIKVKETDLCKKIIRTSIHGVEVKRWAITVAEMRLWLKIIVAADEHEASASDDPLLPDLQDNIRLGDALVSQKSDNIYRDGFDIVIGNPPYITSIKITPPLYAGGDLKKATEIYKDCLRSMIRASWGNETKVDANFDYLVYFYYKGLTLLKDKGILCFITQNSWLDARYGFALQEFLLKNVKIRQIYNNMVKRSFKQADINTVISILQKEENIPKIWTNLVSFITLLYDYEDIFSSNGDLLQIEASKESCSTPRYRVKKLDQLALFNIGREVNVAPMTLDDIQAHGLKPYSGLKWGSLFLKAPEIYFKMLHNEDLKGSRVNNNPDLVYLEDIFDLKRGITTAANDFFYFTKISNGQGDLIHCENKYIKFDIEGKYTAPFIKSPDDIKTLEINLDKINDRVLWCQEPKTELQHTKVLKYIEWGETFENKTKQGAKKDILLQGFHQRESLKAKPIWYALNPDNGAHFFVQAAYDERFKISYSKSITLADKRLYQFDLKPEHTHDPYFILGLLNSSLMSMVIELNGISNLGEGVLNLQVFEAKACLIPDPSAFTGSEKEEIASAIKKIMNQAVPPVFDRIRDPEIQKIDQIVLKKVGLSNADIDSFYKELVFLIGTRKKRAASLH